MSIATKLIERHVTKRCPLYFKPSKSRMFCDRESEEWLTKRSVKREWMMRHYVPSRYAAAALDMRQGSLLSALREGRLGLPLYDYSQYDGFDQYVLWVSKAAIHRHRATRRGGGRPRST